MILHAIITGVVAWVFCLILIEPDMIFFKWNKVLDKLPMWLSKPLGKCEYCLTGQLSFWLYLYKYYGEYDLINHIFFVSLSIFTVRVINKYIHNA